MTDDLRPLLTSADLATLLRVSVQAVHQMSYLGTGPPVIKLGRRCRYSPAEVTTWLRRQAA